MTNNAFVTQFYSLSFPFSYFSSIESFELTDYHDITIGCHDNSDLLFIRRSLDNNNKNQSGSKKSQTYNPKYLWIRQALFEKQLAKIIDYLVNNSR